MMFTRVLVAALGLALGCVACRSSAPEIFPTAEVPTISMRPDARAFPLGPNDVVSVGVWGHPELSTAGSRIDLDGNLSLPLAGPVRVAGMSLGEAREALTAAYGKFIVEPRLDVSVAVFGARRVYVLGEVTRPGAIDMDRPLNVMQGLALAGGLTSKADRSQVILLRGTPEELEVEVIDAEDPTRRGFIALRGDDLLFVRRTNAGKFTDEILPYLQGIASALSSTAALLLVEDRLKQ